MFKTASSKPKPLRSMSISTPLSNDLDGSLPNSTLPRTTPDQQVILITKFDFKAESKNELTVGVGEALKLIERKGNGWILVKPIGRLGQAGLIPSSYCKIVKLGKDKSSKVVNEAWLSSKEEQAVSEEVQPQTLIYQEDIKLKSSQSSNQDSETSEGSLTKYSSLNSSISSQCEQHFCFTKPSTTESTFAIEEPVAESGLVRNASCHNGRYWYRVDITMSDGKKRHLCRYYQDFYKLHCSIIEKLRSSNETDENIQKLSALPDPIPRPDLQMLSTILLQRCQVLNIYIFRIVQNKHNLDYKNILNEWVQPRLGDIEASPKEALSNERIEELLQPPPTKATKSPVASTSQPTPTSTSFPSSVTSTPKISTNTNASVSSLSIASSSIANSIATDRTNSSREVKSYTMKRPSISISTSVTPPLPAPNNSYTRSQSSSNLYSPVSSPLVWQSPTMQQAPVWRTERSASSPMLPQSPRMDSSPKQAYFFNQSNEASNHHNKHDSFTPDGFRVRGRNVSVPALSTIQQSSSRRTSDFLKIKVFGDEDIFALKVKRDVTLEGIKQSILTRLECDVGCTFVKLYYRNYNSGHFVPLTADHELAQAFSQPKISLKVNLITKEQEMI